MSLAHDWRQAGTTRRAHLVAQRERGGHHSMSACGLVRLAAWLPETDDTARCGLCRRLAEWAEKRGDPMVRP